MSKCDYCVEWEYFEGYQSGAGCFCMQRTEKLPEDEDCEFFCDKEVKKNETDNNI